MWAVGSSTISAGAGWANNHEVVDWFILNFPNWASYRGTSEIYPDASGSANWAFTWFTTFYNMSGLTWDLRQHNDNYGDGTNDYTFSGNNMSPVENPDYLYVNGSTKNSVDYNPIQ